MNAFNFDIIVKNESRHRFSILKDFRLLQSCCSDVQYGSDEMHADAVLAPPVKLHLSISDYRKARDSDHLEFVNDVRSFLIEFSKHNSPHQCSLFCLE